MCSNVSSLILLTVVIETFVLLVYMILFLQEGHLSSNGECFDIGMTVRKALHKFERSGETDPYPSSTATGSAGNGSLMRLCPVPLLYHRLPCVAMQLSKDSSRTTHGAKAALDACR